MPRKNKEDLSQAEENQGEDKIERIPFGRNVQWISANLTVADKQWLDSNHNDCLSYVGEFLESVTASFTLSIKFDDAARRYNATLLCTNKNHPAANCALSLRARTPLAAIYAMAYFVGERDIEPWWSGTSDDVSDPWG